MIAFVVTPGFEPALLEELSGQITAPRVLAPGLVAAEAPAAGAAPPDPVFARQLLPDVHERAGASVSALAQAAYDVVEAAVDGGAGPFTLHAYAVTDEDHPQPGLASRVELVGRELLALLGKRRRRAFARHRPPEDLATAFTADATLLQLVAIDRTRLLISAARPTPLAHGGLSLAPWPAGIAPVTIDRGPPSRAYQKLEEAFLWMGAAPQAGETCVDLGASPGGWTMTALKRGARVIAVDRAALERPAAGHAGLTMTIGNAFTYLPAQPVDWLLCDVICEPKRTVALLQTWLGRRLCRRLVCTVKFKGRENYGILRELPPLLEKSGFGFWRVKQLHHNKNEVTVMGIR
jgi:23S rRNA (cytidine2498-2'-O)-methyltransferase